MNRSESKYFNTAVRMDGALLELLETKPFPYITVKEICEKAGVSRSTFYLHYETVGDLLSETLQHMFDKFLEYFPADSGVSLPDVRECPTDELYLLSSEYLEPYLTFVKENRSLFSAAIVYADTFQSEQVYEKMLTHIFAPILDRFHIQESDRNYMVKFFINGIIAVINEWVRLGCEDSVEHVADVIQTCVRRP